MSDSEPEDHAAPQLDLRLTWTPEGAWKSEVAEGRNVVLPVEALACRGDSIVGTLRAMADSLEVAVAGTEQKPSWPPKLA